MGITEENQEELNGFQLYLDELEGITSCSETENTELAKEAANGSAEAKKRLIEGNLKNALAMIREYLNKGLPAGDLAQEANMALVMAVEELGTAESVLDFNEYLKERVTEALKAAVADQETEHKIEEKMLARVKVLEEVSKSMADQLGREATVEELAERMQMTVEEVKDIMKQRTIRDRIIPIRWLLKAEMQYWKHSGQENRSTKYLYWMGVRTVLCERL